MSQPAIQTRHETDFNDLMRLGVCYAHAGRFSQARIFFEKAFCHQPGDSQSLAQRSIVVRKEMERNRGQVVSLNMREIPRSHQIRKHMETVDKEPKNFPARVLLGIYLKEEGHLEEAMEQLMLAHDLEPDNVPVYIILANVLSQMGRLERAMQWQNSALEREPDNGVILFNLATLFFAMQSPDKALEACSKAGRLLSDNAMLAQVEELRQAVLGRLRRASMMPNLQECFS